MKQSVFAEVIRDTIHFQKKHFINIFSLPTIPYLCSYEPFKCHTAEYFKYLSRVLGEVKNTNNYVHYEYYKNYK